MMSKPRSSMRKSVQVSRFRRFKVRVSVPATEERDIEREGESREGCLLGWQWHDCRQIVTLIAPPPSPRHSLASSQRSLWKGCGEAWELGSVSLFLGQYSNHTISFSMWRGYRFYTSAHTMTSTCIMACIIRGQKTMHWSGKYVNKCMETLAIHVPYLSEYDPKQSLPIPCWFQKQKGVKVCKTIQKEL